MLNSSHSADSISTSVVASEQPLRLAAHDAGERLHPVAVGDDADRRVERIGFAVERQQRFALAGAAHHQIAKNLGGVEDVQRPAAVEGDVVGDVHQGVDRPQADRGQPAAQPFRARGVAHAAHQPQREAPAQRRRIAEVERHPDRARERPGTGAIGASLKVPSWAAPRSRAMPCTPVQSGRLGVRLISMTGSSRCAQAA